MNRTYRQRSRLKTYCKRVFDKSNLPQKDVVAFHIWKEAFRAGIAFKEDESKKTESGEWT